MSWADTVKTWSDPKDAKDKKMAVKTKTGNTIVVVKTEEKTLTRCQSLVRPLLTRCKYITVSREATLKKEFGTRHGGCVGAASVLTLKDILKDSEVERIDMRPFSFRPFKNWGLQWHTQKKRLIGDGYDHRNKYFESMESFIQLYKYLLYCFDHEISTNISLESKQDAPPPITITKGTTRYYTAYSSIIVTWCDRVFQMNDEIHVLINRFLTVLQTCPVVLQSSLFKKITNGLKTIISSGVYDESKYRLYTVFDMPTDKNAPELACVYMFIRKAAHIVTIATADDLVDIASQFPGANYALEYGPKVKYLQSSDSIVTKDDHEKFYTIDRMNDYFLTEKFHQIKRKYLEVYKLSVAMAAAAGGINKAVVSPTISSTVVDFQLQSLDIKSIILTVCSIDNNSETGKSVSKESQEILAHRLLSLICCTDEKKNGEVDKYLYAPKDILPIVCCRPGRLHPAVVRNPIQMPKTHLDWLIVYLMYCTTRIHNHLSHDIDQYVETLKSSVCMMMMIDNPSSSSLTAVAK